MLTSLGSAAEISCRRCFDFVGGGDGVFAGLLGDHQGNGGHAIETGGATGLFITVFGVTDVADLDDIAVSVGHSDLVELVSIGDTAGGADGKFLRAGVEVAAGKFEILGAEGVEDVGDGEVIGAQAIGVDEDMDFAAGSALDGDFADAFGVFELLLDLLIGDEGDIAQGARRGDGDLEDGGGVGIEFLDDGLLGGLRQVRDDQVDFVLDFLGGDVAILGEQERDDDLGLAFGGDGADFVHHADGVDGVLDFLGDFGLDFFRGRAGVGDRHEHSGDIDFGKEVDAEAEVGEDADHHEGEDEHGGEDRAADAELG